MSLWALETEDPKLLWYRFLLLPSAWLRQSPQAFSSKLLPCFWGMLSLPSIVSSPVPNKSFLHEPFPVQSSSHHIWNFYYSFWLFTDFMLRMFHFSLTLLGYFPLPGSHSIIVLWLSRCRISLTYDHMPLLLDNFCLMCSGRRDADGVLW